VPLAEARGIFTEGDSVLKGLAEFAGDERSLHLFRREDVDRHRAVKYASILHARAEHGDGIQIARVEAVAVSPAHAVAPVQSMAIKLRSSMRLKFKTVPLLLFVLTVILPGGAGGGNDIGISERSLSRLSLEPGVLRATLKRLQLLAVQNAAQKRRQ
jgi:hypothetical protein